jgi:glycosyltransferase involved in cell wall biosynthesis
MVQKWFSSTGHKSAHDPYFLYVGNVYPHKNINLLLESFGQVAKDNTISLVFVGKWDYFYKSLRDRVKKLGLENKTIFYSNITDEELSSLYQKAQALVLPSLMEGFGLPALEAMANKCLVIVSDIPSFREVCQDAALYFSPHESLDLEKILREVLKKNGKFDTYIQNGLKRVKLFSWKKMAQETLEIYESSAGLRSG